MSGLVLALLGSGEFEPWTDEIDRGLLAESRVGDGRVLILPTASAPEGDEVFDRWGAAGLDHYASASIPAEVVPLKSREDAERSDVIARLDEASLVFFSGGNPAYLAATLIGTSFWSAVVERLGAGLAYAGCSAGAACLPELVPRQHRVESRTGAVETGIGVGARRPDRTPLGCAGIVRTRYHRPHRVDGAARIRGARDRRGDGDRRRRHNVARRRTRGSTPVSRLAVDVASLRGSLRPWDRVLARETVGTSAAEP